jgi:hypothetical protein
VQTVDNALPCKKNPPIPWEEKPREKRRREKRVITEKKTWETETIKVKWKIRVKDRIEKGGHHLNQKVR